MGPNNVWSLSIFLNGLRQIDPFGCSQIFEAVDPCGLFHLLAAFFDNSMWPLFPVDNFYLLSICLNYTLCCAFRLGMLWAPNALNSICNIFTGMSYSSLHLLNLDWCGPPFCNLFHVSILSNLRLLQTVPQSFFLIS